MMQSLKKLNISIAVAAHSFEELDFVVLLA